MQDEIWSHAYDGLNPSIPQTDPGELINNSEYRKRNPAAMTTSKHNESDLYLWKSRSSLVFNYQSQCVPRVKEETISINYFQGKKKAWVQIKPV